MRTQPQGRVLWLRALMLGPFFTEENTFRSSAIPLLQIVPWYTFYNQHFYFFSRFILVSCFLGNRRRPRKARDLFLAIPLLRSYRSCPGIMNSYRKATRLATSPHRKATCLATSQNNGSNTGRSGSARSSKVRSLPGSVQKRKRNRAE